MERIIRFLGCFWIFLLATSFSACVSSSKASKAASQNHPEIVRVGSVPKANGRYRVRFIDEQTAWLSNSGSLWRTTDAGKIWHIVHASTALSEDVIDFEFVNRRIGCIITRAGLFKTVDGGDTWSKTAMSSIDVGRLDLRGVTFNGGGTIGWIAGGEYRPVAKELLSGFPSNLISPDGKSVLYGVIFRTADGGATWHKTLLNPHPGRILTIFPSGKLDAWAMGDAGIFRIERDGVSWKEADLSKRECANQNSKGSSAEETFPSVFDALAVYFVDAQLGWISFKSGEVAKTTDGGRTWCNLITQGRVPFELPWEAFFSNLYFEGPMRGWALGSGSLYQTEDGGINWRKIDADVRFDDMSFLESQGGWAIGKDGLFRVSFE